MSPTVEGGPAIAVWDGAAGVLHVTVRTERHEQALARIGAATGATAGQLGAIEVQAAQLAAYEGTTVATWLDRIERIIHAEAAERARRWSTHIFEHPERSRMHAAYHAKTRRRSRR